MTVVTSMFLGLVVLGQVSSQSPPKEWVEANQCVVGTWNMTGTIGGKACTAIYKCDWVDGKYALRGEATWKGDAGTGTGVFLVGWDAAKSQEVNSEFWSDGGMWIYRSTVSGKKWKGVGEGTDENGQLVTSRWEQEILGPDKYVFRATMVEHESKKEIPCELFFTRATSTKKTP